MPVCLDTSRERVKKNRRRPNHSARSLGKPYESNAILENNIEYILTQRNPSGYPKPTKTDN
jgi:hypothetical protein